MKTIRFENVGRNKDSWEQDVEPTEAGIIRAIKARKALMSNEIEAYDGCIYAGGRLVGKYSVLEGQSSITA